MDLSVPIPQYPVLYTGIDVDYSRGSPNIVETALDLGARFLLPLRDSDTRSLTFGMAALIISSIASFISDVRTDDDDEQSNNIDMNISNVIENRNGEPKDKLFFYQSELNKMQPISSQKKEKTLSTNHLQSAIKAYEDFMIWAKKETRDNEIILEDVLELAVAKARGMKNPADQFYKYAGEIVSYAAGSIAAFASSLVFWNGFV